MSAINRSRVAAQTQTGNSESATAHPSKRTRKFKHYHSAGYRSSGFLDLSRMIAVFQHLCRASARTKALKSLSVREG
jgi:hypothetical protein